MNTEKKELYNLAKEVLEMLRLQQVYFKFRKYDMLQACKGAESKVKEKCNEVIKNTVGVQEKLF